MKRLLALDTETTGLKSKEGDRIIEIAIVEVTRDPNPRTLNLFFNPEGREIHPEALEVHGISAEFLENKPTFRECISDISNFIDGFGDDVSLVIHNAPFDLEFLRDEYIRADQVWPEYSVVDTLKESIRLFGRGRHSLDALCTRFNIDRSARVKHGGLIDTMLLAEVYLAWFGQGGLDFQARATTVSKDAIQALGPLNPIHVPQNRIINPDCLPAKSWEEFFAENPI